MNKKFAFVIAFLLALGSLSAIAGTTTVTNLGQVITITVLDQPATGATNRQNQSVLVGSPGQIGMFVVNYNYADHGAIASNRAIQIETDMLVPKNTAFMDGYLVVNTPCTTNNQIALTVGGVTVDASGTDPSGAANSIYDVNAGAYKTTASGYFTITNAGVGTAASVVAGDVTWYIPYMLVP